jgi:hypothetical protein
VSVYHHRLRTASQNPGRVPDSDAANICQFYARWLLAAEHYNVKLLPASFEAYMADTKALCLVDEKDLAGEVASDSMQSARNGRLTHEAHYEAPFST